ncbi:MAG: DUF433 domain-containing protein [Acidobacteria bacterium]|nr:DUF433 domain-containing protein [Acidobacteriota bacterium]
MRTGESVVVKSGEVLGGTPVFAGTRVPFQTFIEYLEAGETLDGFLDDFPTVSREQAVSALELAKRLLLAETA